MAAESKIEWCDSTLNPWEGCQKVGPGCDHCYAEARNARFGGGVAPNWGPGAPRRRTSAATWNQAHRWEREHEAFFAQHGRRRRVFCASLADVFDNAVPPAWRAELFALIAATPHLDWLLLTKRIGNVGAMIEAPGMQKCGLPANVWLGISVVNQAEADRDIPKLLAVPASVRFLSMEPLLGQVDVTPFLWGKHEAVDTICQHCPRDADCECGYHSRREMKLSAIDWVIVGGESGSEARPIHPDWVRSLRDQCAVAGVSFLFKQWGEWASVSEVECPPDRPSVHHYFDDGATVRLVGKKAAGRLLNGVQHDGYPEPRS